MGCASGNKVPGLPWKDQATALCFSQWNWHKAFVPCPDQASLGRQDSPDQVPLAPLSRPFHKIVNIIL